MLNSSQHNETTSFLRGILIGSGDGVKFRNVLPKKLNDALARIGKYKDIRVIKADKGNCTVIMNTDDYIQKMSDLLSDNTTYKKLDKTLNIGVWQSKFNAALKKILYREHKDIYNKCISPKLPNMPYIYGLPKIHKNNCPLRPIVSATRSPPKNLAVWLSKVLGVLVGIVSEAHTLHSSQFINELKNCNIAEGKMISFDVTALFTNVPVNKVLDFLRTKYEDKVFDFPISIDKICALIELCLRDTFFEFNNDFYVQVKGCSMGSSLSPILANLYMEFFESSLVPNIQVNGFTLRYWKRYVDDVFAIAEYSDERAVTDFVSVLNNQEQSIKFTYEESNNDQIPFLDVLISKRGSLYETTVYRKPTHTDQYIHFFSFHSKQVKRSTLIGLFLRAFRICDPQLLNNELDHIFLAFGKLAYPRWFILSCLAKARGIFYDPKPKTGWNPLNKTIVKLPYSPTLENITKSLEDPSYSFVFDFPSTIKSKISKNKLMVNAPTTQDNKGVYILNCTSCNESYVGETGRSLKTRIDEHKNAVRQYDEKSAVASHCWNKNHHMDFDNCQIVFKSNNIKTRRLIEGVIMDSINTVQGNKPFSKVDSITKKLIIGEANLDKKIMDLKHRGQTVPLSTSSTIIPSVGVMPTPLSALPDPLIGSTFLEGPGRGIRRSCRLLTAVSVLSHSVSSLDNG